MAEHVCIDCRKLSSESKPRRPRKTTGGPRSQRCREHRSAQIRASSKASHERRVQATYGLAPGEYDALYAVQNGKCAICQVATGKKRRLAVDHDHVTGVVRGLLCTTCNHVLLGRYGVDKLQRAIDYLEVTPYSRMLGELRR